MGAGVALVGWPGSVIPTWADASQANALPGIAAALGERLEQVFNAGAAPNWHAVYVLHRGVRVLERYQSGADERWGRPLGNVAHQSDTRHDVRSVTKSVVGLLYGIALAEGIVPALDSPVVAAFPEYPDLVEDAARQRIRVADVLAMTMGLDWNEDLPYSDPRNSEIAMERSADRYRFVLERPVVAEPGTVWRYSGGATALLGRLISQGTGQSLDAFARSRLFSPLGIDDVEWVPGRNGEPAAASGLRLRAPDLARVGQLLLQRGQWEGRSIVPAEWVAASLLPRVNAFEGVKYGYHWYVAPPRDGAATVMAIGWGGQRLVVVPSLDLVYVIFMGNYRSPVRSQLQAVWAIQGAIHSVSR